jgi:putative acetyltransferase
VSELVVEVDDPRDPQIIALLERHLAFAHEIGPPEGVFALDVEGLLDPAVTFFSARLDGVVLGVGALKELDPSQAEIKSMHTSAEARRRGVARAIVERLIDLARERGYHRLYLETGSMEAFAPARALYESVGFVECGPFADYPPIWSSTFMTLALREEV